MKDKNNRRFRVLIGNMIEKDDVLIEDDVRVEDDVRIEEDEVVEELLEYPPEDVVVGKPESTITYGEAHLLECPCGAVFSSRLSACPGCGTLRKGPLKCEHCDNTEGFELVPELSVFRGRAV